MTRLLYKLRVSRSKRNIPLDGKGGVRIGDRGTKLKPYFQEHTFVVLTDKPLIKANSSPEAAGRMALWVVELSEFNIRYRPRTAIKGKVVANFITKFTLMEGQGQKWFHSGESIRTDLQISKQKGPMWYYTPRREIRSSA